MSKKKQMHQKVKKLFYGLMTAIVLIAVPLPIFAAEDGAYIVSRTTSYANPETGQTVDGGTNIALGDSMSESIVEKEVLVEQSKGKTYVTLGIGLISNISNVKMQIQGEDGTYRDVEITQTGSHEVNGDTCNHYRFEVDSTDKYISPIIYVDPMGRDVQFFVKLDMATAKPGTGVFLSEMIPAENEAEEPKEENDDTSAVPKETETQPEKMTEETKAQSEEDLEEPETQPDNRYVAIGISAVVLIVAGAGAVLIYRRRKK
ncbi:MAG: NEAT domain-containing protein [Muricomes sp.]